MPWFPQCEAEKGERQQHQPMGRAVLHQAADETFVCGQELRWAEEGPCTTEDARSATGFGGQVGNVAFPGKIRADSEIQKLEGKDFFQFVTESEEAAACQSEG